MLDPPFGLVRRPRGCAGLTSFGDLIEEALQGVSRVETPLQAGILPPEAMAPLLQIAEQNRWGNEAGSKWLREIAGEIGELVLREPIQWAEQLQGALNAVADCLAKTSGRPTPIKWARIFAKNLGRAHERAGRLTPMARVARAARRRWAQGDKPG